MNKRHNIIPFILAFGTIALSAQISEKISFRAPRAALKPLSVILRELAADDPGQRLSLAKIDNTNSPAANEIIITEKCLFHFNDDKVKEHAKKSPTDIPLFAEAVVVAAGDDFHERDLSLKNLSDILSGKSKERASNPKWPLLVFVAEQPGLADDLANESVHMPGQNPFIRFKDYGTIAKALKREPKSIALLPFSKRGFAPNIIKINGVEATIDNIKSGEYPLQRRFFVITPNSADTAMKQLIVRFKKAISTADITILGMVDITTPMKK